MSVRLVGRADVLATIDDELVRVATDGPHAVLLEGAPGSGRSALWRHACEDATARGWRVLACRPTREEQALDHAALADLLESLPDETLAELPAPQRAALDAVLLRVVPAGPLDPRQVAAAVRSVLVALTDSTPVLLAIDDLRWLDRATAAALRFALRRLADHPLVLLATDGHGAGARDGHRDVVTALATRRLRLDPLPPSEVHRLLHRHLGGGLRAVTLRRVARAAGGSPGAAIALATAIAERGADAEVGEPLPVPDRTAARIDERLSTLPPAARDLVLTAACATSPTGELMERVVGSDADRLVAIAVGEGLLERRGDRLHFADPLVPLALEFGAGSTARRRHHELLARVVTDPVERARHLAVAASAADADVAEVLDAAADEARARGNPGTAGDLAEWAAALTPAAEVAGRCRRLLVAAEHQVRAGDLQHGRALLEAASRPDAAPEGRARTLQLLGELRYQADSFDEGIALLEEALALTAAPDDAVRLLLHLAYAYVNVDDIDRGLAVARRARQRAEATATPGVLAEALAVEANVAFHAGFGLDLEQIQRAQALEDPDRDAPLWARPGTIGAIFEVYGGSLDHAARRFREVRVHARRRGEEESEGVLLLWLARTELWRGELAAADLLAEEMLAIASRTGSDATRGGGLMTRASVRAARGEVELARDGLTASADLLAGVGWTVASSWATWELGALELAAGDPAAAVRAFAPSVAAVEAAGVREPFSVGFVPDAVDALTADGQIGRAEQLLECFERRAHEVGRAVALVTAARARAHVLAAQGDVPGAIASIEGSLRRASDIQMPIERGRSLLLHGQLQRRARRKQPAREAIEASLVLFDGAGARLWADLARAELARVGQRPPPGQLTATEQRVADLAAAGRTNQAIAAALFISPKTVEANITRVYRKLGIHSRAELGRAIGERAER